MIYTLFSLLRPCYYYQTLNPGTKRSKVTLIETLSAHLGVEGVRFDALKFRDV